MIFLMGNTEIVSYGAFQRQGAEISRREDIESLPGDFIGNHISEMGKIYTYQ